MPRHSSGRTPLELRGLIDRIDILRLSVGMKRGPAVDTWLMDGPAELRSIAREWFMRMRACGDDVREQIHDGCPVACVEDAPFGYVNAFKSHVNVGFFYGAFLDDPAGLLEGNGKRMRHVKIKPGLELDVVALRVLIDAAHRDIRLRLADEPSS